MAFLILPLFGMYGLYEMFNKANLIEITFSDSFMKNVMYFGFILLVIYLITLILDILSKIIIFTKKKKIAVSKGTMIFNYCIQAILSTYIFKLLVDNYFSKIDISLLGSFLSFVVVYLIYYAIIDDYEIEQQK